MMPVVDSRLFPILSAVLLVVLLALVFTVSIRSCSDEQDSGLVAAKKAETERIEKLIADNEARAQVLQDEIDEIHEMIEGINDEIEKSAAEREDLHGVVDGAGSIRELDRILKQRKRERK